MELFTRNDDVARWESALLPLRGAARLPLLVPLAWHLRQRDTRRAAVLADEALTLLPAAGMDAADRDAAGARLQLVLAEAKWLYGQLAPAADLAHAILRQFSALGDAAGCADTHWLLAWIAVDLGDHGLRDTELEAAAAAARSAGDTMRVALAEAAMARWAVLSDLHAACARWSGHFDGAEDHPHPALATWTNDFLGLAASQSSDFGAAAGHFIAAYQAALETGQVRAAITAATNIGEDFTLLGDHPAALEWMQCALDLARPNGWPRSIGACLMHTADTMRRMDRLDAAHDLLQQALAIMAPLAGGRSYATALKYLGDLALDQGDYGAALDAFKRLEQRGDSLNQSDFHSSARRGQAHALSHLGRPLEALAAAHAAVAMAAAQNHLFNHIAGLRVLAMIHARHTLPAPEPMTALNPSLHYLHRAMAVASTIEGYSLPGDLLDTVAQQYASAGDYAHAYQYALAAGAARAKSHGQEATNRAIAMQVHHQTEQARAEGAHHRELAASEARRSEVLQRTSATLERLSAIGQEITTHLDARAVFQALNGHVHALLSANKFAIYLTDPSGKALNRAFGVEAGKALPNRSILLTHPNAYSVRCLAERREIHVENAQQQRQPGPEDTPGHMSALFQPLTVGERAIGVMTVQATEAHAYGEHERLIFRTLCAYGAIALDNAEAYRQLQNAQARLVSQEKLAAVGALMAGVAHELNTPIGNSLLIASTLQQKTDDILRLMSGPGLRRSQLDAFIADAQTASTLVMRGLTSAADLVNSFKQVAVDRTTEQRRSFDLQQVAHESTATMMNRVRACGHEIELDIPADITMDSYPGPLGQVIANLINNALVHAFENSGGGGGRMWLTAAMQGDQEVQIRFRDNGAGIAPENQKRIFDPFFTTKLGQGGSGLGLSISYNIVGALMGGQIGVDSGPGLGTTFILDLPLTAPLHERPPPKRPH
jgi:signal transduction histidine kinase/tetratricopeptide (TPR) repeat protein